MKSDDIHASVLSLNNVWCMKIQRVSQNMLNNYCKWGI